MTREKISWTSKDESHLYGVTRGLSGTVATEFPSNASLCNATLLVFATDVTLNPEPGYIGVGSEKIYHNGLTQVGTVYHCDIATRGADGTPMYAHGPGAPVYDPVYNINNPATGTSVATYGVRSDTAYAGSALDRNTLDIYALKQLNEKKDALEYGQMTYTGLDVWQNATYGHMKSVSFTCPATDVGIFTINLHRATGTDTLTDVYLGENVKESFWDIRFRLSTATGTHIQHSLTTSATNIAVATVMVTSPPTIGTLNLYYGSSWAVDYSATFSASGITSLVCATMSTDVASTYNINDRGIVNVNCGDIFTLEETDGATKAWMVSGLEYDQSAGKLTVTYGVVEETALEQMSRNSEAFDIGNDVRAPTAPSVTATIPLAQSVVYSAWAARAYIELSVRTTIEGYQVLLDLEHTSGMNTDFSDIRFTDMNDTPLAYVLESKMDGVSAKVRIKLPSGTQKFLIYIGNQTAESESSWADVYDLYDDFEGTTIDSDKWYYGNCSPTVSSGCVTYSNPGAGNVGIVAKQTPFGDCVIEHRSKGNVEVNTLARLASNNSDSFDTTGSCHWYSQQGYEMVVEVRNGGSTSAQTAIDTNVYKYRRLVLNGQTMTAYRYPDGDWETVEATATLTSSAMSSSGYVGIRSYSNRQVITDWFRVRKYMSPEPTCTVGESFQN